MPLHHFSENPLFFFFFSPDFPPWSTPLDPQRVIPSSTLYCPTLPFPGTPFGGVPVPMPSLKRFKSFAHPIYFFFVFFFHPTPRLSRLVFSNPFLAGPLCPTNFKFFSPTRKPTQKFLLSFHVCETKQVSSLTGNPLADSSGVVLPIFSRCLPPKRGVPFLVSLTALF